MSDEWIDLALCQAFANLPWLENSDEHSPAAMCAMKAVCGACPVFDECHQFADEHEVTAGFWAGQDRMLVNRSAGGEAA
jgi:hypothetical protein